jgi:hypothetical protein
MPSNVDALVNEGIAALKSGRRAEARQALQKATEIEQQNEKAWLWLSAVVDTPEERLICLENVLALNPSNQKAQRGLEETQRALNQSVAGPPPSSSFDFDFNAPAQTTNPFAGTGFEANPYSTGSTTGKVDPALAGWTGVDLGNTPSSVEWGPVGDVPAAPRPPVNQPTSQEYDDWMASLGLKSGSPASGSTPAFGGLSADDPFGTNATFGGSAPPPSDPFGVTSAYGGADPFGSTPAAPSAFGDFNFESPVPGGGDPFGMSKGGNDPFSFDSPPTGGNQGGSTGFDFDSGAFKASMPPPVAPIMDDYAPIASPSANDFAPITSPFETGSGAFGDYPIDDAPPAPPPTPARKTSTPAVSPARKSKPVPAEDAPLGMGLDSISPSSGAIFTTIDSTPSLNNQGTFFKQIPPEIQLTGKVAPPKATATSVTAPLDRRLVISVGVLAALNVASIILLIVNILR